MFEVTQETLDYATPPTPRTQRDRGLMKLVVAFLGPPAAASLGGLLMRVAIHYSYWAVVPLFLLLLLLCGVACLLLAWWTRPLTGGWRVGVAWFLAWFVGSVACAGVGLALVDMLPIRVGDGP